MAEPLPDLIEELVSEAQNDDPAAVLTTLASEDDVSVATVLESLPVEHRIATWEGLPRDRKIDVLVEMRSDPREILIDATPDSEWSLMFADIEAESLLELMDSLPSRLIDLAFKALDTQQQAFFREATQFSDDEIGHWLSHEQLVLPINAKVRDALRLIRRNVPGHCDTLFLTNRSGQFSAAVKLTKVFGAPEHVPLVELTVENMPVLKGTADSTAASLL